MTRVARRDSSRREVCLPFLFFLFVHRPDMGLSQRYISVRSMRQPDMVCSRRNISVRSMSALSSLLTVYQSFFLSEIPAGHGSFAEKHLGVNYVGRLASLVIL